MLTLVVLPAAVGVAMVLFAVVVGWSRRDPATNEADAPPVDLDFLRYSPWQASLPHVRYPVGRRPNVQQTCRRRGQPLTVRRSISPAGGGR